ncbi:MAG: pilus assembly protein [Chloroflexi bacterium]|nr:MAG: pilus assembly protein [Chloroflexota bacterium]
MKERLEKLKAYLRSERSQGLTEFAIIAPVILLLTFGIIDFGRGDPGSRRRRCPGQPVPQRSHPQRRHRAGFPPEASVQLRLGLHH